MGRFFPLDDALWLLPQQKTSPHIEEHLTRLSGKLPYREAVEEVERLCCVKISATTAWRTTCANGSASDQLRQKQVASLSTEAIEVEDPSTVMQMSSDGCMVGLNNGEWREVKTVTVGNVETQFDESKKRFTAKLTNVTAISSSQAVRQFEELSALEIERRGIPQAETVISLNGTRVNQFMRRAVLNLPTGMQTHLTGSSTSHLTKPSVAYS